MPAAKNVEPIKTGFDPRKKGDAASNGNGSGDDQQVKWFKLESGGQEDVTILVNPKDIVTCEQCAIWLTDGGSPVWVYTGPQDPFHELGVKEKKYKAFLPLVMDDGSQALWGMSKTVHGAILDIADATGKLKGLNIRIKRQGKGLQTRYSLVPMGTFTDVSDQPKVDVLSKLGPLTLEGVRELVAEKLGYPDYDQCLAAYQKENPKGAEEDEEELTPKARTERSVKKERKPKVEELSDLDVADDDE